MTPHVGQRHLPNDHRVDLVMLRDWLDWPDVVGVPAVLFSYL